MSDEEGRARLLAELGRADAEGGDPVDALAATDELSLEAQAVVRVLRNQDAERFDELYRALPNHLRDLVTSLSPLVTAAQVRAPVEVVVPPSDVYFPLGEAQALAQALPNAHLTVTGTLDHTRPNLSLGRLRDLRAFNRFVVRGLRAAG